MTVSTQQLPTLVGVSTSRETRGLSGVLPWKALSDADSTRTNRITRRLGSRGPCAIDRCKVTQQQPLREFTAQPGRPGEFYRAGAQFVLERADAAPALDKYAQLRRQVDGDVIPGVLEAHLHFAVVVHQPESAVSDARIEELEGDYRSARWHRGR